MTAGAQLPSQPYPGTQPLEAPTVSGRVSDGVGPLAGARVTLFDQGLTVFRETRTDGRGRYTILRAPVGGLRLGVALRDHDYIERGVVVGDGSLREDFVLGPETHPGSWADIGSTLPEFLDATDVAILRPDGRIFYCHDTTDPIEFDPLTGAKVFPPGSPTPQGCTQASLLEDGRIVFVGGQSPANPGAFMNAVPWVKTFDPAFAAWALLPDLNLAVGRWYPGLARLADGALLAMGGGTAPSAVRTDTCEVFDPQTGSWSWTGSLLNPSEYSPSALLFTGEVLATWSPPQLWNPRTGQWRAAGPFVQPTRGWPGHSDHSIVVLDDGRVLALGILQGASQQLAMAELYDPQTDTWSLAANSELPRFQAEIVALPDGRVLAAGGESSIIDPPVPDVLGIVRWTDLYDPATDSWRRLADMADFREYHAVTLLLPDGRVATTGGTRIKFQVGPTSADIEALSPPYLFRGVRPGILSLSTNAATRGQSLALEIFPATQLTSVVLMGTGSPTHWVDGGIPRRIVLDVVQSGATASVVLPSDPNVLPLGHYQLVAMVDDIPSVARSLLVRADTDR